MNFAENHATTLPEQRLIGIFKITEEAGDLWIRGDDKSKHRSHDSRVYVKRTEIFISLRTVNSAAKLLQGCFLSLQQ